MANTVQVRIEVGSGASRFRVSVRTAIVRQALRLVGAGYGAPAVHAFFTMQARPSTGSGTRGELEEVGAGRVLSATSGLPTSDRRIQSYVTRCMGERTGGGVA